MPAPKFTIPTTAKFVIKGLLHDCVITTHMPNGYINNALDIERLKCNAVVTDHEEMKVRLYDDLQRFRVVYAHAEAAFICDTLRSDTHQQDINPEVSMDSEITEEFGEFFSITEPGYSERLWNYDSIDQFFKYVEENKSDPEENFSIELRSCSIQIKYGCPEKKYKFINIPHIDRPATYIKFYKSGEFYNEYR